MWTLTDTIICVPCGVEYRRLATQTHFQRRTSITNTLRVEKNLLFDGHAVTHNVLRHAHHGALIRRHVSNIKLVDSRRRRNSMRVTLGIHFAHLLLQLVHDHV